MNRCDEPECTCHDPKGEQVDVLWQPKVYVLGENGPVSIPVESAIIRWSRDEPVRRRFNYSPKDPA